MKTYEPKISAHSDSPLKICRNNTGDVSRWFRSKYQNFHFCGISSISLQRLQSLFSGVSQKIENSSLYRTVYKDIFYVPSRIGEPKYIEWWPSEKPDFCGSILTEIVSKILGAVFLTADSERAWKTALDATCSILITHWFDV